MKYLKYIFLYLTLGWFGIISSYAQSAHITLTDIKHLLGDWKGTLTYLDYTSNRPYTMPSEVNIRQIGKGKQFVFSNIYPDEPKANNADTLRILLGGHRMDKEVVKTRRKLLTGDIEIVTEYKDADGNAHEPALIRHTYTFGKTTFVKRKEVQFVGKSEWIKRNEYNYTRK